MLQNLLSEGVPLRDMRHLVREERHEAVEGATPLKVNAPQQRLPLEPAQADLLLKLVTIQDVNPFRWEGQRRQPAEQEPEVVERRRDIGDRDNLLGRLGWVGAPVGIGERAEVRPARLESLGKRRCPSPGSASIWSLSSPNGHRARMEG